MKKIMTLILMTILIVYAEAQKTTNVKGYYRKDGTYVRPHTRTTKGSSTSKISNYSTSKNKNRKEVKSDDIISTTLTIVEIDDSDFSETTLSKHYPKNEKIIATQLVELSSDSNTESNSDGVIIYVSVLRYNGITLDICPITRGILGDWEFSKVQHRFLKTKISADEALDLISNYGWQVKGNDIIKDYSYSYNDKGLPKYLTKTTEAIKLM